MFERGLERIPSLRETMKARLMLLSDEVLLCMRSREFSLKRFGTVTAPTVS